MKNMPHVSKHVNLTDSELIDRLFREWKSSVGTLFEDPTEDVLREAEKLSLQEGKDNIITIHTDHLVGFGYNRSFEKLFSKTIRAVVVKEGSRLAVLTAYPDVENYPIHTNEFFDFSSIHTYEEDSNWNLFLYYLKKNLTPRYVPQGTKGSKKSQVKISIGRYSFSYNGNVWKAYRNGVLVNHTRISECGPFEVDKLYDSLENCSSFTIRRRV